MKLSWRRVTGSYETEKNRTPSSTEGGDLTTPAPEGERLNWGCKRKSRMEEGVSGNGAMHAETMRPIKV